MKTTLFIIILLFSLKIFSQDFEGEITYTVSAKSQQDIPIKLLDMIGNKSVFVTKKGAFKQTANSTFMALQIYNPIEGALYYKNDIKSDTLLRKDVRNFGNEIYEYEIVKNADTILGYVCDKLIQKSKSLQQHFYYNSELKLNPAYFENFVAFEKNKVSQIIKAVYLRTDLIYPNLTISSVAIEIKKKQIDDLEFVLPKNQIIVKD